MGSFTGGCWPAIQGVYPPTTDTPTLGAPLGRPSADVLFFPLSLRLFLWSTSCPLPFCFSRGSLLFFAQGGRTRPNHPNPQCYPLLPAMGVTQKKVTTPGFPPCCAPGSDLDLPLPSLLRLCLSRNHPALGTLPNTSCLLFFSEGGRTREWVPQERQNRPGNEPGHSLPTLAGGGGPSRGTVTSRGLGMPGGKPPNQPAGLPSKASTRLLGTHRPLGLPLEDPQPTVACTSLARTGTKPARGRIPIQTPLMHMQPGRASLPK